MFTTSTILRALGPALFLVLSAGTAAAFEIRAGAGAVLELFTSQGCPRCPDADRLLARYGEHEEIVALAYHIDYWDYIGWEDTFALPANTELQKAYAQSWGKTRIYTPQMVINGGRAFVGSDEAEARQAIADASLPLPVTLTENGPDVLAIDAPPNGRFLPAIVWLVPFRGRAEVAVERGENTGRALVYTHIVTGRHAIGMWQPDMGAQITVPLDEVMGNDADGFAILIQEKNGELPGRMLGAGSVRR